LLAKLWVQHAKCTSFVNFVFLMICDFLQQSLNAKCFLFLHCLIIFSPLCFKCNSLVVHHVCNVSCEVKVWTQFEVWMFSMRWEHVRSKVFLWGQRFEVKGVRLKVEGLRFGVYVSSYRFEVWNYLWGQRFEVRGVLGKRLKVEGS
jgi:hypothetical protein